MTPGGPFLVARTRSHHPGKRQRTGPRPLWRSPEVGHRTLSPTELDMRDLRQASDMVDVDYPPFFIDRVEDAVAPGPQAPQIWRLVRERLLRPRLIGELANRVPECSDTDGIVAEETRRLVQSLNLPVDLIAHRDGRPRRRPASS